MKFKTTVEKNDINEIVSSKYINWEFFKNSTILVTGATGLIGSQIVKTLLYANKTLGINIKVLALIRNLHKATELFNEDSNLEYLIQDINEPLMTDKKVDFIIHTANSTASKDFVDKPVETINTIVSGTNNILEYALNNKVKSLVYLSSMEVYGQTSFDKTEPLKENEYGYIDILHPRSSYPESKKLAESLCSAYYTEYSLPVKTARLVQTIGAGVDINDNRVFVQFAKSIINSEDIILHTTGESSRSYCYITDAITAILVLLERGQNGESYNVANSKTNASIRQMAEMLSNKYINSNLKFELDNKCYPPSSKLHVDTSKLNALMWEATVNLETMYDRLISAFKECL